ncbi:SH3 domain-containing protein, partial [Falsiroseomonas oryziterrae]|uniref:SH3 domain-containing protein n=1 Tax=Falsiroseomonas oryziterrae TaxID=2911368 RepID=UPI001F45D4E4
APLGLPSGPGDTAPRAALIPPVPTEPPVMSGMSTPAAGVSGPMYGEVTTSLRSPVNLRAAPGGPVLGTVPRGTTLQIFDMAPGGWLLVGDTGPLGWVHVSGVER